MNENPNQVQGEDTSHATDKPMQENTNLEQNFVSEDTTTNTPVDDAANQSQTSKLKNEVSESDTENTEPVVSESDVDKVESITSKSEVSQVTTSSTDSASVDDTSESDDVELDEDDEEEQETEDISSLSKTELFDKLTYIVENKPVNKVYQIVEDIRARYNEIVEEECERRKRSLFQKER